MIVLSVGLNNNHILWSLRINGWDNSYVYYEIYYDEKTDTVNFDGSSGIKIGWVDNQEELLRQKISQE